MWCNREEKKRRKCSLCFLKGGLPIGSTAFDIPPFSLTSLPSSRRCSSRYPRNAVPSLTIWSLPIRNLSKNCLMLRDYLFFTQNPFLLPCRPLSQLLRKSWLHSFTQGEYDIYSRRYILLRGFFCSIQFLTGWNFSWNLTKWNKIFSSNTEKIFLTRPASGREKGRGLRLTMPGVYKLPAFPAPSFLPPPQPPPHSLLSGSSQSPRTPRFLFSLPPCGDLWNWAQLFYLLSFLVMPQTETDSSPHV